MILYIQWDYCVHLHFIIIDLFYKKLLSIIDCSGKTIFTNLQSWRYQFGVLACIIFFPFGIEWFDFWQTCLALRYEALVLRDEMTIIHPELQVTSKEWLAFTDHSLESGFHSIANQVNFVVLVTIDVDIPLVSSLLFSLFRSPNMDKTKS